MKVEYKNKSIEKICTDASVASKKYGDRMAGLIQERIGQIKVVESVTYLLQARVGRCHPLVGNRKGQYAMDLTHPYRLVFEKHGDEIQIAKIIEIVDYH